MTIPETKKRVAAIGLAALIATSAGAVGHQATPNLTKTTTETIAPVLYLAQEGKTGIVTLSNANNNLNVRSGPSSSYAVIAKVKHGTALVITGESGNFYKINLNGRTAYVSKQYVMITSTTTNSSTWTGYVKTSNKANRLNLRSAPNQSAKILAKLPYGTRVNIISSSGGWYYIQTDSGLFGHVNAAYISSSAPSSSSASSAAVMLNVPSYKQYDGRWSSVKIGNKTIKQVGCVVTSAAMVHSYKSGSTVYPDTMRAGLKFSNNDIYWNSLAPYGLTNVKSYNSKITNSIMSKIHEQLKAGTPVIIGGKKSNGTTHYVVVTGYNANSVSSFSTSNFTINDPNSSSRTTLAQFLATYPTVIKLVY